MIEIHPALLLVLVTIPPLLAYTYGCHEGDKEREELARKLEDTREISRAMWRVHRVSKGFHPTEPRKMGATDSIDDLMNAMRKP